MNRLIAKLWLCVLCLLGGNASAVVITFTAVDLADAVPGQDLWQYNYTVNGTFLATSGFELHFDSSLYDALHELSFEANWTTRTEQSFLGADGLYIARADIDLVSVADAFALQFVWLGGTGRTPGIQPFYLGDDGGFFPEGDTVAPGGDTPVPEPATLVLVAGGLMLLGRMRKLKTINLRKMSIDASILQPR